MTGTSDSSNSSRASMASQAFACQTDDKSQSYHALTEGIRLDAPAPSLQRSSCPNVLTSSTQIRVCTAMMSLGTNIRARGWTTKGESNQESIMQPILRPQKLAVSLKPRWRSPATATHTLPSQLLGRTTGRESLK